MPSYRRYRVTYKGRYLFHCFGTDDADALSEARQCAQNNAFSDQVVSSIVIALD